MALNTYDGKRFTSSRTEMVESAILGRPQRNVVELLGVTNARVTGVVSTGEGSERTAGRPFATIRVALSGPSQIMRLSFFGAEQVEKALANIRLGDKIEALGLPMYNSSRGGQFQNRNNMANGINVEKLVILEKNEEGTHLQDVQPDVMGQVMSNEDEAPDQAEAADEIANQNQQARGETVL